MFIHLRLSTPVMGIKLGFSGLGLSSNLVHLVWAWLIDLRRPYQSSSLIVIVKAAPVLFEDTCNKEMLNRERIVLVRIMCVCVRIIRCVRECAFVIFGAHSKNYMWQNYMWQNFGVSFQIMCSKLHWCNKYCNKYW